MLAWVFWLLGIDEEEQRPPRPNPNHHLGTEKCPYRISDPEKKRRMAIQEGINERANEQGRDTAIDRTRKRLILIRTLHRNRQTCPRLHSDLLWLYEFYELDASRLEFTC
tara:strand:+ start:99 stop:428 length:330 start_codon:yes stop_codon:yes gene_type:complete